MTVQTDSTNLFTKSGKPLRIGTGTGTKWKDLKRSDTSNSDAIVDSLKLALDLGFYHIDTAEAYTTQPEVAKAVKQSGQKREDLWLTTKYSPGGNSYFDKKATGPAHFVDLALEELDTDYIDLVLLHHPFFDKDENYSLESAWKELISAQKAGKVRYIGASNFAVEHLQAVIAASDGPQHFPVLNQIEFHPYLQNQSPDIVKFSQDNNILVEAYGPLTPLFRIKKDGQDVDDHPLAEVLPSLAANYGRTPAQILLRYALQKGILPVTTSSKPDRIKESLQIYEFELTPQDVEKIDTVGNSFPYRAFFGGKFP